MCDCHSSNGRARILCALGVRVIVLYARLAANAVYVTHSLSHTNCNCNSLSARVSRLLSALWQSNSGRKGVFPECTQAFPEPSPIFSQRRRCAVSARCEQYRRIPQGRRVRLCYRKELTILDSPFRTQGCRLPHAPVKEQEQ